jgi:hypothetical protein
MNIRLTFMCGAFFVLSILAINWPMDTVLAQDKTPPQLKLEKVEETVWRYFRSQPKFQVWMLITKEQVEPLLSGLVRMGFNLSDAKAILEKLPAGNEFLVAELYSPAGRKFMERIAKYPEAYDRLDRLSRLPHGRQIVHDLIYRAGGEQMIQYLTTTSEKELSKMISNGTVGADFNKPTGRIYTVPMLLVQLQEQYRAAEKLSAGKK